MNNIVDNEEIYMAIENLYNGIIPEDQGCLLKTLRENNISFELCDDSKGFFICTDVSNKKVKFNNLSLRAIWLIVFNIWKLYERSYEFINTKNIDKVNAELIKEIFNDSKTFLRSGGDFWPNEIPIPDEMYKEKNIFSIKEQAVFDLNVFTVGFVFLHEFNHIFQNHPSYSDNVKENHEHELESDTFAMCWILKGVNLYCKLYPDSNLEKIYFKRLFGILMGMVVLLVLSGPYDTDTHPCAKRRLKLLIDKIDDIREINDNDAIWCVAFTILLGFTDSPINTKVFSTNVSTVKQMVLYLYQLL